MNAKRKPPNLRRCMLGAVFIALISVATSCLAGAGQLQKAEIEPFVAEVAKRFRVSPERARALMSEAKVLDKVLTAISRPAERMAWKDYRKIFLTRERIAAGADFLNENRRVLDRAESKYGVPGSIISAIIGVETFFGRIKGRHRVLDSLATLGFRYKRRAKFFRNELAHFIALTEEEGIDATSTLGSYAGAMGIPQFIPTSYRAYAVDFNGDKRRDLLNSVEDAVGSVGNYLARHGWGKGEPVAFSAGAPVQPVDHLVNKKLKPTRRLAEFIEAGLVVPAPMKPDQKAALYALRGAKGTEYWIGLKNFYVITRYNHSKLYALAVFQLSSAIADEATSQ